jgi:engulfment/cell motility protein 1
LQGVRGVLEFDSSWADLTDDFVDRVLYLLVSAGQPNVIRPATAIVRKLVISSPHFSGDLRHPKSPGPKVKHRKSKGKEKATAITPNSMLTSPGPINEYLSDQYGFDKMFMRMSLVGDSLEGEEGSGGERFFRIIVKRLESTGDLELVAQR